MLCPRVADIWIACGVHGDEYEHIRLSNILHARMNSLFIGTKLCWQAGFNKVVCFSYSLHVVHLVTNETSEFHQYTMR